MSDDATERAVSAQYGTGQLTESIENALRDAGVDPERVTLEQLAPIDHFHSFGTAGTLELARRADIASGDRVLDVGGGVGGPARLLASRYGANVTVLDLTPEFCQAGEALTRWTRLSDRVAFVCGSALDMPFADGSFDVAWTQHAAMNIADKPRLYREIHRVLRPGGRFALFDVLSGAHQPIHFPVPWADDQASSFLLPPDDLRTLVIAAGFVERTWLDGPELVSLLEHSTPDSPGAGPTKALLIRQNAAVKFENNARNMSQGHTMLGLGIYERV